MASKSARQTVSAVVSLQMGGGSDADLFNDTVYSPHYAASNERLISE
jgi:hypothetical protein